MSIRTAKMYLNRTQHYALKVRETRSSGASIFWYPRYSGPDYIKLTNINFAKFRKAFKNLYRKQQKRLIYQSQVLVEHRKVLDKVLHLTKRKK